MSFKLDTGAEGLGKLLREYQELALRCVWEAGEDGVMTKQVHDYVTERARSPRSLPVYGSQTASSMSCRDLG